jgi:Spy/CpxP family protein refolding chaperone
MWTNLHGDPYRMPWSQHKARHIGVVAALCMAMVVASAAVNAENDSTRRSRWWDDEDIQRELHLSPAQVKSLDATFERKLPERIARQHRIEELDQELQHVIDRGEADDETVMRLSGQVEALRSQQNVRRALMLLAMYKVLTPDQRMVLTRILKARLQLH